MNNASFSKQTIVYFKKISRIAIREKAWIFVLFAVIISFIVTMVTAKDMFENFESSKSGFFTLASACIWIGIFNSIQSICKEHNIIRSEYRQGMKLSSYIFANVLWQAVLCFIQSIIIFVVCWIFDFFGERPGDGVFMNALGEYFITIFLLTFGAAVLGLMVSSFSGTPNTAMKIMPFVLILQLIMSGVLFELKGVAEKIAYITFSKWGMSAFGSTGGINGLESKVAVKLAEEIPNFDKTLIDSSSAIFNQDVSTLLTAWGWCVGLIIVFIAISVVCLKLKNRDS